MTSLKNFKYYYLEFISMLNTSKGHDPHYHLIKLLAQVRPPPKAVRITKSPF
jgi:hypothetical protein